MADRSPARRRGRVPVDWRERFIRAYDIELQEWIGAASAGRSSGPSSWDGYAATVVCDADVAAFGTAGASRWSCASGPSRTRGATGAETISTD